ncbi:MAG TPA: hypothetical protein VGG79_03790 [Roseiarcus sp.]
MSEPSDDSDRSDYYHAGNLDRIRDAPPQATAAVHRHDVTTMSELARRGFHLIDMSGEVWTMRRG